MPIPKTPVSLTVNSGFGVPIGTFFGSLTTDFFDNRCSKITREQIGKAVVTSFISFGLASFGNVVSSSIGNTLYSIENICLQYLLSYESAILSISNSVIGVFWPRKELYVKN